MSIIHWSSQITSTGGIDVIDPATLRRGVKFRCSIVCVDTIRVHNHFLSVVLLPDNMYKVVSAVQGH